MSDEQALDPKEQMRRALDAKKKQEHRNLEQAPESGQSGHVTGKASGKRQFRRKTG